MTAKRYRARKRARAEAAHAARRAQCERIRRAKPRIPRS